MNPISGSVKMLFWPICRAYSRYIGDRPADSLLRIMCSIEYLRTYKCWPNLNRPRRFTEKVWHRLLYDRNPILTTICDKYRVRNYVAEKIGNDYLIPLLWDGEHSEHMPFNQLPMTYVIKTNHGCSYNIIVKDNSFANYSEIKRQLDKWMKVNFCHDTYLGIGWGYKNIKPRIMVETFIGEKGKSPVDYKFFCFAGQMEFFKVDLDRHEDHSERFFDRDFNELNVLEVGLKHYKGRVNLPDNIKEMITISESLSDGFDFIRVDLYSAKDKIFFGELTPYPGGVSARFEPDSYDFIFGDKWKIQC